MKKKYCTMAVVIYIILFGIVNVLMWGVFFHRTKMFAMGYFFMFLAFVVCGILMGMTYTKNKDKENNVVKSMPIFMISFSYVGIQCVVSLIAINLSVFLFKVVLIIELLMLLVFILFCVIFVSERNMSDKIDLKQSETILTKNQVLSQIEHLYRHLKDEKTRVLLIGFEDKIKYCSTNEWNEWQKKVIAVLADAKNHIEKEEYAEACNIIDKFSI